MILKIISLTLVFFVGFHLGASSSISLLKIEKVSDVVWWFTYVPWNGSYSAEDWKPMVNATMIYWNDGVACVVERPLCSLHHERMFVLDIVADKTLLWSCHSNPPC